MAPNGNRFDGEILSVRDDNGWTIDVIAFEGDPPAYVDDTDVLTPIATPRWPRRPERRESSDRRIEAT